MIKIIVSGTSDGFYPRYASDGVLDDQVSQCLLDRRRLLSRDTDRLYREGYSFQPLQNLGILYHKLILLYDGFGRDGFVMASLFLPSGDSLSGKDIKEALDSILKELKARSVNGMASFELDWSFVKRKADELNQSMVKPMYWHKNPVGGNKSYTALIEVPESLVADYFQYPNPLHSGFASFGQVFLTGSLLDPNAVSDNGDQGYRVLSTNDVDIEDTEYIIVFDRDKGSDENLDFKKTIRKKVLLSRPGDYRLGTVSKYGYRSAEVKIKAVDKNSEDGCTVKATLPVLTSKGAKLQLEIVGKDTGESIQSGSVKISDILSRQVYREISLKSPRFSIEFKCEYVDRTYILTVDCDKYDKKEIEVNVQDGQDVPLKIELDARSSVNDVNKSENLSQNSVSEPKKNYLVLNKESRNYSLFRNYKKKGIPIVVEERRSLITYNYEYHRLECENSYITRLPILLMKDKYEYQIANPKWSESLEYSKNTNIVKRTLRPVYKISIVSGIIALATVIIACIFGLNNKDEELYRELQGKCEDMLAECKSSSFNRSTEVYSRYVGDSLLNCMESLETELKQFMKEHSDYQNDSVFNLVSTRYNEQKSRKDLDEQTYDSCKDHIKNATLQNIDEWKMVDTGGVLSLLHYDDLNNKCDERIKELQGEEKNRLRKEEGDSYAKCSKDKLDACKRYYDKYNNSTTAGYRDTTHLNEVKGMMNEAGQELYDVASDRGEDERIRLAACKTYLDFADYFSGLQYKKDIQGIQNELSPVSGGQSTPASGEKIKITSWDGLRTVLENVDEVKLGTTKFSDKYEFSGNYADEMKTTATSIVENACSYSRDYQENIDHYIQVFNYCSDERYRNAPAGTFIKGLKTELEKSKK